MTAPTHSKKKTDWLSATIGVVAVVNFAGFVVHVIIDRAAAFPAEGRFADGQFFVRSHGHEVAFSPSRYWFSYIHGVVFVAIHIAAMLVGLFMSRRVKDAATASNEKEPNQA